MAALKANPGKNGDPLKTVREWFDVIAKVIIAIVGVIFAFYADDYRQKTSLVTLLSQRETAESELKSNMLQHLIGPFVGRAAGDEPLDPRRARALLDLLALNFHTHFELKPLLLKVDSELQLKGYEDDRRALRSTARRVVDRQIAMLWAAGSAPGGNRLNASGSAASSRPSQANLWFVQVQELDDPNVTLLADPDGKAGGDEKINRAWNPALFTNGAGQGVCSLSPDRAYAVRFRVEGFDPKEGTAKVAWSIADAQACKAAGDRAQKKPAWQDGGWPFTLSPYDFPLTDNAPLDPSQRFALNLYNVHFIDQESSPVLQIKLVWFPRGYITERERPMNYYQVNKTLGLE